MATKPKETGLICTGESVRGILAGIKSQTRRVIKPQPTLLDGGGLDIHWHWNVTLDDYYECEERNRLKIDLLDYCKRKYGVVGDRLYVKEAFQIDSCAQRYFMGTYQADSLGFKCLASDREINLWDDRRFPFRKTSGRSMYKSLARLWLEITGIRVERVQDISLEDCYAEGVQSQFSADYVNSNNEPITPLIRRFQNLWGSINAKRGYGWEVNPWVWVVEFRKVKNGD